MKKHFYITLIVCLTFLGLKQTYSQDPNAIEVTNFQNGTAKSWANIPTFSVMFARDDSGNDITESISTSFNLKDGSGNTIYSYPQTAGQLGSTNPNNHPIGSGRFLNPGSYSATLQNYNSSSSNGVEAALLVRNMYQESRGSMQNADFPLADLTDHEQVGAGQTKTINFNIGSYSGTTGLEGYFKVTIVGHSDAQFTMQYLGDPSWYQFYDEFKSNGINHNTTYEMKFKEVNTNYLGGAEVSFKYKMPSGSNKGTKSTIVNGKTVIFEVNKVQTQGNVKLNCNGFWVNNGNISRNKPTSPPPPPPTGCIEISNVQIPVNCTASGGTQKVITWDVLKDGIMYPPDELHCC